MSRIEKLINWLKEKNLLAMQMFDTRNIVGDKMETIYSEDGITVDICHYYQYLEIFGLSDDELDTLTEAHFATGAEW